MEDLPLGRIAALVPEFAVRDLPLGRTQMMMMDHIHDIGQVKICSETKSNNNNNNNNNNEKNKIL